MMKILVLSDIHNSEETAANIIYDNSDADAFIFLGDGERAFETAMAECGINIYAGKPEVYQVAGNCDWGSTEGVLLAPEIGGVRFCITHGHGSGVKSKDGKYRLADEARRRGCRIALFGHTHSPYYQNIAGVELFNPGAVMDGCYGVISINDNDIRFEQKEYS